MAEPLFFQSGTTGLADVGYRFFDSNGDWVGSRITSGVFETDALNGTYGVAAATIPETAKGVHWDSSGTPTVQGDEIFDAVGYATISAALSDEGNGAYVVTVTVTNASGGAALENALVRLAEGTNAYTALTNASGVATFALDAATYTRSITKAGFVHVPDTIVVSGAGNHATTMAAVSIPAAPSNPAKATVYAYFMSADGQAARNVTVTATLDQAPALVGSVVIASSVTAKSNDAGLVTLELFKTDTSGIMPADLKWRIVSSPASLDVTTAVTGTLDLGTFIT